MSAATYNRPRGLWMALSAAIVLWMGAPSARAFTLIGPPAPATFAFGTYYTFAAPAGAPTMPGGNTQQGFLNFVDPMGWPVPVKEFYRWNFPELTYAFDASFIRYFGHNGMQAIHNTFRTVNDYFDPEDGAYSGVSSLDLIKEYDQHFATWKFNPSANVGNVTDMQTIVLGLLVNHLGLGNPHRYCYIIRDIVNYTATAAISTGDFHITLRNYDPYTYQPSPIINGVTHSYFIFSNPAYSGAPLVTPTTFDAVEYAVSSDNEFSAVAAIRDVINFGGQPWPQVAPTVFRTPGVYFGPEDSRNKPALNATGAVRDQPRHTLTFDDAGGLRYLYRTNNIVWEALDATVTLVTLANMNPPPRTSGIPPAVPPNTAPFNTPQVRTITGLVAANIVPANSATGSIRPAFTNIVRNGLRGGINKIKFSYLPYDSLLGTAYHTNNSVWTDVFITNALPTDIVPANPPYFSQVVQRTTTQPDIIFIAQDLGVAGNVLPVIQIPDTSNWDVSMIPFNTQQGAANRYLGPGVIRGPAAGASIQYAFTTRAPFHQVIWAGQPGIEGNMITQFQWGWITNTGPNDFIRFPESDITQVEAITGPSGTVAEITALSVYDGAKAQFTAPSTSYIIDRAADSLIVYGRRLDTVKFIKILDHNSSVNGKYNVVQTIDARRYIMSDQQIVLPPGALDEKTVTTTSPVRYRRISLLNTQGDSASELIYQIRDGRPIVTSTQYDGLPLNTTKSLIIQGSGFKSANGIVNQIWFFDDNNASNYLDDPNTGTGTFPIPVAILDINATSGYVAASGVGARNSDIVITDNSIYLPPHLISDGSFAPGATPPSFISNEFGTLGQGNNMARSEGNNTDPLVGMFIKHMRVVINPDATGQPNANVRMSAARPTVQGYTQLGVGGDRNASVVATAPTMPTIIDSFTDATIPGAPVTAADANRTWMRGNDADVLTIRGTGLDLAVSIEFVDGLGFPIQSTDANGLAPQPVSLRQAANPSALAPGVVIVPYGLIGSRDAYEIRISPVTFGFNGNALFDSAAGTNPSQLRRVVIRTPFGTAMAPAAAFVLIQ